MAYELHEMDCRLAMSLLMEPDSMDSIVTDPPYHLTTGKRGGSGPASVNTNNPAGRARIGTGFMGMTWDGGDVAFDPTLWTEALRVLKPGGYLVAFSGSRTYHRMVCAIEDAGFEIRDQLMWLYGSGFPKGGNRDGKGTCLKPAHEPIVLARKPLVGTVVANEARYGTGALNIDACRIGTSKSVPTSAAKDRVGQLAKGDEKGRTMDTSGFDPNTGRWPANVLHDGSDEVLAGFPTNAGAAAPASGPAHSGFHKSGSMAGAMNGMGDKAASFHADSGSAARFFYCAKASKADRDEGLADFTARAETGHRRTNIAETGDNPYLHGVTERLNVHPTVKPTAVMEWLVRLVTPPGGTVFDPFAGSGSTGKAAIRKGYNFVGCEVTPEYATIARARLDHALTARSR